MPNLFKIGAAVQPLKRNRDISMEQQACKKKDL